MDFFFIQGFLKRFNLFSLSFNAAFTVNTEFFHPVPDGDPRDAQYPCSFRLVRPCLFQGGNKLVSFHLFTVFGLYNGKFLRAFDLSNCRWQMIGKDSQG
jgi:hypothetical protein